MNEDGSYSGLFYVMLIVGVLGFVAVAGSVP
jgi:hypothetical protein